MIQPEYQSVTQMTPDVMYGKRIGDICTLLAKSVTDVSAVYKERSDLCEYRDMMNSVLESTPQYKAIIAENDKLKKTVSELELIISKQKEDLYAAAGLGKIVDMVQNIKLEINDITQPVVDEKMDSDDEDEDDDEEELGEEELLDDELLDDEMLEEELDDENEEEEKLLEEEEEEEEELDDDNEEEKLLENEELDDEELDDEDEMLEEELEEELDDEDEEEEKLLDEDEEEDEEVEEMDIDGVIYYVTTGDGSTTRFIYEIDEDGDIGNQIGTYTDDEGGVIL